jgi:peptidoglycan/LPS O-acetylase OafA/YrhL
LPRFHHSWSLAVEEHFYLVFPVVVYALCRWKLQRFIMPTILIGGAALFVVRLWIVESGGELQTKLSHWRTEALIVGVSLAWLDQTRALRDWVVGRRHVIAVIAAVSVAIAAYVDTVHEDYFQLPLALAFGLLVVLAIGNYSVLERLGHVRAVTWISRISYSLYLVHPMVLLEVSKRDLPARFGPVVGWSLTIVISLGISLVAAEALYRLVERPGLWVRERLRRRGAAHSG